MREALEFIKGAVSHEKSAFAKSLRHLVISNGRVTATNGMVTMSAPIACEHNFAPDADKFIKAILACEEPQISMTPAGRVKVSEKSFRVLIDNIPVEHVPLPTPDGVVREYREDIRPILKALQPFTGKDISRPWSRGIILRGGYAYATTNVVLACYTRPCGFMDDVVLPADCVDELLRIDAPIKSYQLGVHSLTFHFSGDRWLRTQLIEGNTPDIYAALAKGDFSEKALTAVPDDLASIVARLKKFTDDDPVITFRASGVEVGARAGEEAVASDSSHSFALSAFRYEQIKLVLGVAKKWNLTAYPSPCAFVGDEISGVIVGVTGVGNAQ